MTIFTEGTYAMIHDEPSINPNTKPNLNLKTQLKSQIKAQSAVVLSSETDFFAIQLISLSMIVTNSEILKIT